MINSLYFNSKQYEPLYWYKLLIEVYAYYSNNIPVCLTGEKWIILPTKFTHSKKIKLISRSSILECNINLLEIVKNDHFEFCELCVARNNIFDKNQFDKLKTINFYFFICKTICTTALKYINKISNYTIDHLRSRKVQNDYLIKNLVIQNMLADNICLLKSIILLINRSSSLSSLAVACDYMNDVLDKLAILGGGRSILHGNVIDLIFHLKAFRSIYLIS